MTMTLKQWQKAYSESESVQRWRPTYSDAYLNNPHKGTATFQRFEGDLTNMDLCWNDSEGPIWFKPPRKHLKNKKYPPTRISYCRWLWSVLEPEKGKIRYDIIEAALEAAAARGQMLQIRTQPYTRKNVPLWYWDLGGSTVASESKRNGFPVPNNNDPLYIKHWGEHITALGKYFDGHPNLESFDVAYAGACGENGENCSKDNAEKLARIYLRAFKKTPLIGMLATDGNRYLAKQNRPIGWRADCFGDMRTDFKGIVPDGQGWNHMQEAYPMDIFKDKVTEAWKTAPVTFETCWTVGHWAKQGWDIDEILAQGLKYHISIFMPKSSYIPDKWMDKIMEFNKKIGYRFFVHNMIFPLRTKAGSKATFKICIDNKGIAPIYRPYRLAIRLRQGKKQWILPFKADIRKWMPDFNAFTEAIQIPNQVKKGYVELDCAIIDDNDQPAIKMAHQECRKDQWYPVTHMEIL